MTRGGLVKNIRAIVELMRDRKDEANAKWRCLQLLVDAWGPLLRPLIVIGDGVALPFLHGAITEVAIMAKAVFYNGWGPSVCRRAPPEDD